MVHKMNTDKIITVIKTELRKNKITYKQVATRLRMTEAGVKKLLTKDDISLKKLESICDLMNMPLVDVLKSAENENVDAVQFNDKQVQYFLIRPHFFHFFMKLAYEQKTPIEIQNEFRLTSKSISMYLKKLEELNLIRRHPHDHNQIVGGIPLALITKGTELENFKFDITLKLLNELKQNSDPTLKGAGFYLSSEQREIFTSKVESTIIEFSALSRANRKKSAKSNFADCTFMSFVANSSMFSQVIEL